MPNSSLKGNFQSRHIKTKQHGKTERMMGNGVTPDTDTESSLPTVGVVAALRELVEEIEEVLSARANGARGGGLDECTGGLNGRF